MCAGRALTINGGMQNIVECIPRLPPYENRLALASPLPVNGLLFGIAAIDSRARCGWRLLDRIVIPRCSRRCSSESNSELIAGGKRISVT